MRGAADVTNVVDACNLEGRQERLEGMLGQLEACEKALQDYLETKRISFPRFYFVAPAGAYSIGCGRCRGGAHDDLRAPHRVPGLPVLPEAKGRRTCLSAGSAMRLLLRAL